MDNEEHPQHRIWLITLLSLLVFRLFFHSIYLPVFEGPDEPFHLARAVLIARGPVLEGLRGELVPGDVVSAIKANPCSPDLAHAFGCMPFDGRSGAFNILARQTEDSVDFSYPNYESHQPPLYYLAAGALLAVVGSVTDIGPVIQVLLLRLLGVMLVLIALFLPLRGLARSRSNSLVILGLLVLLLPGMAEALVRCSNDAGVFLWCAIVVWAIDREKSTKLIVVTLALGPLIKLTALPVVVFGTAWLLQRRGLPAALVGGACSMIFLPIQYIRGWMWGGTVELNVPFGEINEGVVQLILGFTRSAYTFLKTFCWLGGWSFFRPAGWVLGLGVVFVAVCLAVLQRRGRPIRVPAHLLGLVTALVGFVVFSVGHRLLFDTWGGIGGWYAWGWFPWLALMVADLFEVRELIPRSVFLLQAALVCTINIAWLTSAAQVYGPW